MLKVKVNKKPKKNQISGRAIGLFLVLLLNIIIDSSIIFYCSEGKHENIKINFAH